MAFANGQIWITHWGGRQVGIWDPNTNTFTPEFNTPSNAGGLAYDPTNGIMWVGLGGGTVVPYTRRELLSTAAFSRLARLAAATPLTGWRFLEKQLAASPNPPLGR